MPNSDGASELDVKVYYEDTDAGGVVYHANYLRYMERARVEWLRELGFEQRRLAEEQGTAFVVRRIEIVYKIPARLDDILTVHTRPLSLGAARLVLRQEILLRGTDRVAVSAEVEVIGVDSASFRPRRIPGEIVAAIRRASPGIAGSSALDEP